MCDIVGDGALDVPKTVLTDIGRIVDKHILSTNNIPSVTVDKCVIMLSHVHMIIMIRSGGHGDPPLQVYDIIGRFKSYTDSKYGASL